MVNCVHYLVLIGLLSQEHEGGGIEIFALVYHICYTHALLQFRVDQKCFQFGCFIGHGGGELSDWVWLITFACLMISQRSSFAISLLHYLLS